MSSSTPQQQAQALRLAGYFALLVAFLSSFNWLATLREHYVTEHQWPAATATVYQMREDSREVTPSSSSGHSYWVYWVEFSVLLDLPRGQCPGETIALNEQEQCTGTVKTPEVKSRGDAMQWFGRHPRDSKVIVHYDLQSGRMVLGGESIFDIYPRDKIGLTVIVTLAALLMLGFAKSRSDFSDDPQGASIASGS